MSGFSGTVARIGAIFRKELIQMRRDRMTFAMMLMIPVVQLIIFGFAINMDPKHLPTAVYAGEKTPIVRTLLSGMHNSGYFDLSRELDDPRQSEALLASGKVSFVLTIPPGFSDKLIRGERPQLLIEADASDPAAASNAIGRIQTIIDRALLHDLTGPLASLAPRASPIDVVIHPKYNPEGITQYNIVPGLLGVILTMTMVMMTAVAMTREAERGTLENMLAMPGKPGEVMIGKITPYIGVGLVQTLIVLLLAHFLFEVPFLGPLWVLTLGLALFIVANLAIGFTISTVARSQMQAMQMTFFMLLPSILLSGFMFPFRGMPVWAQTLGEILPLTHFLRVVRGVMLKSAGFAEVRGELLIILAIMLVTSLVAILRYRRTLD